MKIVYGTGLCHAEVESLSLKMLPRAGGRTSVLRFYALADSSGSYQSTKLAIRSLISGSQGSTGYMFVTVDRIGAGLPLTTCAFFYKEKSPMVVMGDLFMAGGIANR